MAELNITHTVSFHQSAFSDAAESAQIKEGATLREWLTDNVTGFDPENPNLSYSQPLDMPVTSDVQIIYTPKGSAISSIFKPIFKLLGLTQAKPKAVKTKQPNEDIEISSVQANQAKYGESIREAFGKTKIYPDYIAPPHRYFADKKNHWSEMLLCVGVGNYDLPLSEIRIGDTPLVAFGDRASARVYQPNELILSTHAAWWHSVPEVGGTRDGSSGLPLRPSYETTPIAPDGNKTFSNRTVVSLADPFPSDWVTGSKLSITYFRSYAVAGNRITGPIDDIDIAPGDSIDLLGDLSGTYTVGSVQGAAQQTTGTPSILTGDGNFSTNYTSPSVFSVVIGRLSGLFTLNDDYGNATGVVSELNRQADASAIAGLIVFSHNLGKLVVTEMPEYGGVRITIQNISNATNVFGDIEQTNTNSIVGDSATYGTSSSFTLVDFNVATQNAQLSIKKTGGYFELVGLSGNTITVQRRKQDGSIDWSGFNTAFTLSDSEVRLDESEAEGGWQGWFDVQPQNETCSSIEADILFPQGLYATDKKGRLNRRSANVTMQWREIGGSGFGERKIQYREALLNQAGFTVIIPVTAGRWQFRVKRDEAEYGGTSGMNRVELFGLRSYIVGAPRRYPNLTTLHIKIKGSEAASAEADEMVSCVATRILNGSPSRDIADAVAYIARTQNIDTVALQSLQTLWQSRGDTFDFSYEKAHTIKQGVNIALGAGFAEMTVRDGLLTPVRDQKRSTTIRAHSFSAQNTTAPIVRERDLLSDDETYGIDVEYMSNQSWRVETVKCRAGLTGAKIEKLKLDGITDRDRAWRYGMRELMRKRYQRETISTSTELDALNANYNDLAAFIEDVPQYGQSALITDINGGSVRVTERIDWSVGADMVAVARDDKGRLGATVDISRIDDYTFLPSAAMDALELYQTVFIGTRERIATIGVVTSVKPSGNGAKITAVNYTDRIYDFDDAQADN